ncbi:MAG: hypothetical protein LBU05_05275, partial [Bifidobacteriaceae bacterium]|nr:hypothetical protein [Bifidobacteriaceae bacterium]
MTKRDLNHHTAAVLASVGGGHDVVVTERGTPKWRLSEYQPLGTVLDQWEREGKYTRPLSTPEPWPDQGAGGPYSSDQ